MITLICSLPFLKKVGMETGGLWKTNCCHFCHYSNLNLTQKLKICVSKIYQENNQMLVLKFQAD